MAISIDLQRIIETQDRIYDDVRAELAADTYANTVAGRYRQALKGPTRVWRASTGIARALR